MPDCQLCDSAEADKKGSHIIPHFLMKRIDNEIGKKGRNKEVGFEIGGGVVQPYYGQEVLPEKLSDIYTDYSPDVDKFLTDIPMIVDFVFCTECEKKLAIIENEYSNTINVKSDDSKISPAIAFLFWMSIIWRSSISERIGLNLKTKESNLLQRLLHRFLRTNLKEIEVEAIRECEELMNMNYRLMRSPHYSEKHATFLIAQPYHQRPYSMLIDEYVLFWYFKKGHFDNQIQSFYGFEELLSDAPINNASSGEIKQLINEQTFAAYLSNVVEHVRDDHLKSYSELFDAVHRRFGDKGEHMPGELKTRIVRRVMASNVSIGSKFDNENVIRAILIEMKNYKS